MTLHSITTGLPRWKKLQGTSMVPHRVCLALKQQGTSVVPPWVCLALKRQETGTVLPWVCLAMEVYINCIRKSPSEVQDNNPKILKKE